MSDDPLERATAVQHWAEQQADESAQMWAEIGRLMLGEQA